MNGPLISLLKTKRFFPIFLTQFLGAFNDNVFKNALVVLITYRLAAEAGVDAQLYVTAAAGLFILPFFLFSSLAGNLSDKLEKSALIRLIKLYEIFLCLTATLGFYLNDVHILLLILFLLGTQSAFFGPLKYGILPDHLKPEELVAGNAMVEAGTFVAILLGTVLGGLTILTTYGQELVSIILLVCAIMGYMAASYIPKAPSMVAKLAINFNIVKSTAHLIKETRKTKGLITTILFISWFWFLGATYLAQFPTYAKNILNANEQVVTLFLTLFSIGIGVGSLICHRLIKETITLRYGAIATALMAVFGIDLYFASQPFMNTSPINLLTLDAFTNLEGSWLILIDLAGFSMAGGLYIVPLYAMMQFKSPAQQRARVIATNNVFNALFMVASAIMTAALFINGMKVDQVFLLISLANIPVAIAVQRFARAQEAP